MSVLLQPASVGDLRGSLPRMPDGVRVRLLRIALWVIAVSGALLTWAWSDVLLWQRIFESGGLDQYNAPYQAGHEAILYGLIVLGAVLLLQSGLRWSIAYAAAVYTLANGGAADLLYYWLDGRALPATLPWLDLDHPFMLIHPVTAAALLASTAVWSAVWTSILSGTLLASIRPGLLGGRERRRHAATKVAAGASIGPERKLAGSDGPR